MKSTCSYLKIEITDSDLNQKILSILSSIIGKKVLQIINQESHNATEISKKGNLPLTKVYKWLHELEDCNLVRVTGIINIKGRKTRYYKSNIDMIMINPNQDISRIEIFGSKNKVKCLKCGSTNCNIEYDRKTKKLNTKCVDCDLRYREYYSHSLKEEKQKVIILRALTKLQLEKDERQKVILIDKKSKKN